MRLSYLNPLDGLRGIAALMVLSAHFHIFLPKESLLVKFNSLLGLTGVSLFFALSGFLITRILLVTKNDRHYFRNFFAKRALRIFPLYYFSLVFYYFILPPLIGRSTPPLAEQVYYWVYLQDFAQTFRWRSSGPGLFWSLAIEEHFYLFWPPIVYFLTRKQLPRAIVVILGLSILVRHMLVINNYDPYYFTFSRLEELAFGSALAVYGFGRPDKRKALICAATCIGCMMLGAALWSVFAGMANPVIRVMKYVIVAAMYASFLGFIIALPEENVLKKILGTSFLRYTGKISYGLYVFHPACFLFFDYYFRTPNLWSNFFLSVLLTFIIADLSFRFLEGPFLTLKKRFGTPGATATPEKKLIVKFEE